MSWENITDVQTPKLRLISTRHPKWPAPASTQRTTQPLLPEPSDSGSPHQEALSPELPSAEESVIQEKTKQANKGDVSKSEVLPPVSLASGMFLRLGEGQGGAVCCGGLAPCTTSVGTGTWFRGIRKEERSREEGEGEEGDEEEEEQPCSPSSWALREAVTLNTSEARARLHLPLYVT